MNSTLVFESKPWLETIVGVLFFAGGVWALVYGEVIFGGGFIIAGLLLMAVFANVITSTFDKGTGRFTRSLRGLIRRNTISHPLTDITGVRVESTSTTDSPSKSYRVMLVLRSRKRVPIFSGFSSGKADKERQAAEIRRFLNLPDVEPSKDISFGDMIKLMRP